MRITKGKAIGHLIQKPSVANVNPVRSSYKKILFAIIEKDLNFNFQGKTGLDLFAGSGSLGLEAISLGAQKVDFVDRHSKSIQTIQRNLNHTYFLGKGNLFQQDAVSYVRNCQTKYDFVFIDPDFDFSQTQTVLYYLTKIINSKALIVFLTARFIPANYDNFIVKIKTKIAEYNLVIIEAKM